MNFFSLANALILSSLLISWASATDLCYRINYNCDGDIDNCENSLLVQPLAKINAGHELLTGTQCGTNYQENQLIPASGRWSQSGSSSNSGSCSNVDGGELMYAYHHPNAHSSNTGFEEDEKAQFLFVVDEDGDLYFVIGLDKPGNADGGIFRMKFESVNSDSPDLAGTTVSLFDDPTSNGFNGNNWETAFTQPGSDKYYWDSTNGRGSMRWKWATCCTDGAVVAGLKDRNIEFTIKMTEPESYSNHNAASNGIDSFLFPSWNNNTNTFDSITEVFWSDIENGLRVSVNDCNTYCGQYTGCSRCATDARCTWCTADGGSCQETTNLDETCPNTDDQKDGCDCNVCEPLTNCADCVASDEVCVWTGSECKSERADGAACDGTVGTDGDCTCDSTQVANSNYAATNSISGVYGATFTVTCNDGFSDNSATTSCNGFQFTNLPVCEAGACNSLNVPNSNYASTPLSGYTGDSFNVICSSGYEGGGTSTCQTNGQFSSVQCTNIQCTDVTIAHATPSPVQGTSFTEYDVTCDEGYHVNGQGDETRTQSATCQSTGQFTTLQTCVANTCGDFSHANSNQANTVTGKTTGEEISVTCNTGYTSDGTVFVQTATCQTDGHFNTLNPCNANTCSSAFVANSNYHSSNPIVDLTTGQAVTVTCNDGYTSDGAVTDQTATCQANGDISSLNACNANTCGDQSITNAVGTPFEDFTTGQVVSVVCDDGYYGGGDMTCNGVAGSFDTVPSCNQILCSQPSILFGTLGGTWDSNVADGTSLDSLNDDITCDSGYNKGNAPMTCGCSANGQPCDTITNKCVSNGCSPPTVLNGQYDVTGWESLGNEDALNTNKISCNSGYTRNTQTSFQCECLTDAQPCGDVDACEPNVCASISVADGILTANNCDGGNAVDGQVCSFSCADGYSGSDTITCDMTGAWPAYPTCTENMCEAISIVASRTTAGANCTEQGASQQPECTFSCVAGYTLSDSTPVSCDYDGNWGPYPTCVPDPCTSIMIANSDYSETDSINGNTDEIRVVTCNDGYTENNPTRVQTLRCDGNTGTFRRVTSDGLLDDVEACVPNVCTPTFHLNSNASEAGSIQGTTGDVVTVTCDVGYTNDGSTTTIQTTCDGQSFSSLDECAPNQCLETSVLNSNVNETGSINGTTGDTIEVVCHAGYSPGGTATCGTDGTFNEIKCEPEACEPGFVQYSNYAASDSINGTTGDTFNIVCDNWFALQGNAQVTCQPNNTLSELPTCEGVPVCLVEKGEGHQYFTEEPYLAACTYSSHEDEVCIGEYILPLTISDQWVAIYPDGGKYNASWSMIESGGISGAPADSNRGDKIAYMEGVDYGIDIATCRGDNAVCCDGSCFYDQDVDRCNSEKTYEACCTVADTTATTPGPTETSESPATPTEAVAVSTDSDDAVSTDSDDAVSTDSDDAVSTESDDAVSTEPADTVNTESGDVLTTQAPDPVTTETVTESPSVDEFRFEVEVNGLNQTFVEENLNEVGDAIGEAFCGKLISDLTESSSEEDAVSCVTMSITLSSNRRRALSVEGATYLVDLKVTSTDSTVTDRISNDNGAVFADITSAEIEQSLQANGIEGAVQGDDLEVTSVELSSGPEESGSSSSSNDNTIIFAAAGAGVLVVVLIISFIVYRRILRHQETMSIKSNLDTNFQTTATAQFDNQNTTGMQMEQQNSVFIENQKSIHEL